MELAICCVIGSVVLILNWEFRDAHSGDTLSNGLIELAVLESRFCRRGLDFVTPLFRVDDRLSTREI